MTSFLDKQARTLEWSSYWAATLPPSFLSPLSQRWASVFYKCKTLLLLCLFFRFYFTHSLSPSAILLYLYTCKTLRCNVKERKASYMCMLYIGVLLSITYVTHHHKPPPASRGASSPYLQRLVIRFLCLKKCYQKGQKWISINLPPPFFPHLCYDIDHCSLLKIVYYKAKIFFFSNKQVPQWQKQRSCKNNRCHNHIHSLTWPDRTWPKKWSSPFVTIQQQHRIPQFFHVFPEAQTNQSRFVNHLGHFQRYYYHYHHHHV